MKVTAIIENTSKLGLPVEHGLSLYIQRNDGKKVLFDMGQGHLFLENAQQLGLSIADVDTAIISHGHYDHGGGLGTFLEHNHKSKVYIHEKAFESHYSLKETGLKFIGIDPKLADNNRLVKCGDLTRVNADSILFADVQGKVCKPMGNRLLFGPSQDTNDSFCHEQNLLIQEGSNTILFAGCAHTGIVNIINKVKEVTGHFPTHVFAGMHLVKSGLDENREDKFIKNLAAELLAVEDCTYYTMHCTGTEQFEKLRLIMKDRIEYLPCGRSVNLR